MSSENERRRDRRSRMALPVHVIGHAPDGSAWEERTTTDDASRSGVSFPLQHPVSLGEALHLALPLPPWLRQHDLDAPLYEAWGVVRKVAKHAPGRIGVLFLGKDPPAESEVLVPAGPKVVERLHPRYEMFLNVKLRRLEPGPDPRHEEISVIENLSEGGAQEPTTLPIAKDEMVFVEEIGGKFRARAQVQNVHLGKDGIPRLNLRFVDPDASSHVKQVLRQAGILGLSRT